MPESQAPSYVKAGPVMYIGIGGLVILLIILFLLFGR